MDSLKKLWASCYDLSSPLVFFPVRHHSPACSVHLRRTLEEYKPDVILIEGPSDTNNLIEHLGHAENKAPMCIYYSYHHKEKQDGETLERRSACYYPMLDFSPELCAIRYGVQNAIPTRFIDLPYSRLALITKEHEEGDSKASYYDDYYMSRSKFIAALCEKQGCRHYGELWEKLFELGGLKMDTAKFVQSVLALCHYSRVEQPEKMLEEDGCTEREGFMAREIQAAQAEFGRVLVITGGFHTTALAELTAKKLPAKKFKAGKAESYLIAYSFAESDQLAGYASGMPYPAFYQAVFEGIERGDKSPYNSAVLNNLAKIGGALRGKKQSTSIADEVAAVAQATGLAELRGKPQQGVYELLDGVKSSYIKGDMTLSASLMMETATNILRGNKLGEICSGADEVPLLLDFREISKKLRLKLGYTTKQEITLDILTKPAHREASAFFHRLCFLNIPFAQRKAGPGYRDRDTARVREIWNYALSAKIEASVIDASYLGGTVREAAVTALARRREKHTGCGEYSKLLIDAAVMGLTEQSAPLLEAMEEAVAQDGSFESLALAAQNLQFLENAKWLLSLPDAEFAARLLTAVYHKAVAIIPSLETKVESEDYELAKALKGLYSIAQRPEIDESVLSEALLDLCEHYDSDPPPYLHGAASGLLHALGSIDTARVLSYARSYFFGSGELVRRSGRFLGGVFMCAWDILFEDSGFLDGLGAVLAGMEHEDFMALLPDLRLAFSVFTPRQIDRISDMVALILGLNESEISMPGVSEKLLQLGRELDGYAIEKMGVLQNG